MGLVVEGDIITITSCLLLSFWICTAVSADSVKTQGSRPTKLIYSWVNICTSLLERGLSVNANKPVNPSPEASSPQLHESVTSAASDHTPVQSAPDSATASGGGEAANGESKTEENASGGVEPTV